MNPLSSNNVKSRKGASGVEVYTREMVVLGLRSSVSDARRRDTLLRIVCKRKGQLVLLENNQ